MEKWEKRDKKRHKKRHKKRYGMKMSGRSTKTILARLASRSPPRRSFKQRCAKR